MTPTTEPRDPDVPDDARRIGGRYHLLTALGRGGMGVVWSAHDELLDREVAVKEVTYPATLDDERRSQLRGRTLREARAAARIRSPAAVTVFDVVEEDGRPWIVMELLPARSLADVLREQGPLTLPATARLGLRLLDALAAAHAAGVLHRDVKPANVLYDASGEAVLTDFGIASLEGDATLTGTGAVIGSPGYIAPERAHGRAPSPASDLWSLGVTLATALHGRSPFERETALATMVAAVQDPLPDDVRGGPLGEVISAMLLKEPTERPGGDEVRERLTAALAQSDGPAGEEDGEQPTAATTLLPLATPSADAERTQALPSLPYRPTAARPVAPTPAAPRPAAARPAVARPAAARPAAARPAAARPAAARPAAARPAVARPAAARSAPAPAPHRRSRAVPLLIAVLSLLAAGAVLAVLLDRLDPADLTAEPAVAPEASTEAVAPEGVPAAAAEPTPQESDVDDGAAAPASEAPVEAVAEPTVVPEVVESPAAEATAEAAAEPAGATVPDNFEVYADAAYQVAVPEGWAVEPDGDTRTRFVDPESRRYLLVEEGGEPAGDPVEDWEAQEGSVAERLDGYERISIEAADFRGFDAADWQFTWEASGGTLRVLNRAVVSDDQAFALYWSVPAEEWDSSLGVLDGIAGSFEPGG